MASESIFDRMTVESEQNQLDGQPIPGDVNWTSWALAQLDESEVWEGHPTVPGLRRFVAKFYGVISGSISRVVQSPGLENGMVACVEHHLRVVNKEGFIMEVSGCADAHAGNVNPGFDKYLTPIAETRAEGRAYIRLLRLNTCSKEEVNKKDPTEMASTNQITILDHLAKKLDFNLPKSIGAVKALTHAKAQEYAGRLAELQRKKSISKLEQKDIDSLTKFKGYQPSWSANESVS